MRDLYKIFHESDPTEFNDIYLKRVSFDSTVRINLTIKPIDQPNVFNLYYIPTNEMINKVSKIYRISNELNDVSESLPAIAKDQFIFERLVEELYNTNELEGVRSTRDEIARSVREVRLNRNNKKRFHSMIKSYQGLINGDLTLPKIPKDIRKIYDEITKEEIDAEELPDGDIFRKDVTFVLKKSGSGKVIHRGVIPEQEIHSKIEQLLKFMNESSDIPLIIKVAVGHYYFGYIHPFYDGNGRTSRFISSMYLSEELGPIAALSLSQGCNKFTKQYLESFEITNSIINKGEMNYFINSFLDIILEALKAMLLEIKEKFELLKIAIKKIENEPKLKDKSKYYEDFMFILAQNHFFAFNSGMTVKAISEISNLSATTVRKTAKDLLELSLIEQKGIRPAYYHINEQYFES